MSGHSQRNGCQVSDQQPLEEAIMLVQYFGTSVEVCFYAPSKKLLCPFKDEETDAEKLSILTKDTERQDSNTAASLQSPHPQILICCASLLICVIPISQ